MRTTALGLCIILSSFVTPAAHGQVLPVTPDSGALIRILRPGAWSWEQATFLRLAGDSLIVFPRRCCGMDTVPMLGVRALEVATGRERKVSRILGWAVWGAVAGAGAGVLINELIPCNGNELCGIGIVVIVPWSAVGGAVIGGLLGSRKVDRWERIYPRKR